MEGDLVLENLWGFTQRWGERQSRYTRVAEPDFWESLVTWRDLDLKIPSEGESQKLLSKPNGLANSGASSKWAEQHLQVKTSSWMELNRYKGSLSLQSSCLGLNSAQVWVSQVLINTFKAVVVPGRCKNKCNWARRDQPRTDGQCFPFPALILYVQHCELLQICDDMRISTTKGRLFFEDK